MTAMKMKLPFLKPLLSPAPVGIAVSVLVGIVGIVAEPEAAKPQAAPESDQARADPLSEYDLVEKKDHPGYIARVYKWTEDIARFDAGLRQLAATAKVPSEEELKKRLESKTGDLEVVTDGYGGVVDFNAAKGTVQYEASELLGGKGINWEFELARDTEIYWDGSTKLLPEIARIANEGTEQSDAFRFFISIAKTGDGPFKAGDRVRLQASIDDFSRFSKDYSRATGLVAIYYLEEGPNPVFDLRLDKAEVTRIKAANRDAGKNEPAKPENRQKGTAGRMGATRWNLVFSSISNNVRLQQDVIQEAQS